MNTQIEAFETEFWAMLLLIVCMISFAFVTALLAAKKLGKDQDSKTYIVLVFWPGMLVAAALWT